MANPELDRTEKGLNRIIEARRDWVAGITLFVATMALYWPVVSFPFVNYDDQLYVYQNADVLKGLSWNGVKYAFASSVVANWHPLTVISHQLDCSVYHLFAGGHHLTNILWHSTDVLLLFVLMRRLTGRFGPSVLVAALFAWHPLNVESVAWVSERKNVLSTFFFILTVLAYLSYTKNCRPVGYILTLVLFTLGLLAKPMLVTMPFLLILLDYWPLQRIFPGQDSANGRTPVKLVLLEKIPFLMLAGTDCVITYLAQSRAGSVESLAVTPVVWRMLNIPIAYLTYLEKAFWPVHLGILYCFPEKLPVAQALISVMLLVIGTAAVWYFGRKFRWLTVGWFWFLGTLVPVIGVVQTGIQSWADRHAYVPLIGIFLIIGCALDELWKARQSLRTFIVLGATVFLFTCLMLTRQQISCWRSSVALFTRAVAVNPANAPAENQIGTALNGEGRFAEAAKHFALALQIQPTNGGYQYDLGRALIDAGQFAAAVAPLAAALKQKPDDVVLRNTLGVALMQSGKLRDAESVFSQAITLQPSYPKSYFNLGRAFLMEGQTRPAITNFLATLQLEPDWPEAMENLAAAYEVAGDSSKAITTASLALTNARANYQMKLAQKIAAELNAYQTNAIQQTSH